MRVALCVWFDGLIFQGTKWSRYKEWHHSCNYQAVILVLEGDIHLVTIPPKTFFIGRGALEWPLFVLNEFHNEATKKALPIILLFINSFCLQAMPSLITLELNSQQWTMTTISLVQRLICRAGGSIFASSQTWMGCTIRVIQWNSIRGCNGMVGKMTSTPSRRLWWKFARLKWHWPCAQEQCIVENRNVPQKLTAVGQFTNPSCT